MVSKKINWGLKLVSRYQPQPKFWCGTRHIDVWFAWTILNLSMSHLLVHKKKNGGNDKETIQSSTTPDPGYHVGKIQKYNNITNKSQQVSPIPAGGTRQQWTDATAWEHKIQKTQMIHKRSTALERSLKNILLEGLNWFHGVNLTISSDVDQDT